MSDPRAGAKGLRWAGHSAHLQAMITHCRRLLTSVVIAALSACATPLPVRQVPAYEELVIDLAVRRATTPRWSAEIVDCSDATMNCIEAPGRFLMAFPRDCGVNFSLNAAGRRYQAAGLGPHGPEVGYVSDKYPTVQLHFYPGSPAGYFMMTVFSEPWPPASWVRLEEYSVRFAGGQSPFFCPAPGQTR